MAQSRLHERQISFFRRAGHDHDGENSSPVKILPNSIGIQHLTGELTEWITQGNDTGGGQEVFMVPDLTIDTPQVAPGTSITGSSLWVGLCFVRFFRVQMSKDTQATITFYHKGTFNDEDREFRCREVSNKFMWEGAWAHYDESDSKTIYWKIENTGNTAAAFKLTLKSGTGVANDYGKYIESIKTGDKEITGIVTIKPGPGISITADDDNNITIGLG